MENKTELRMVPRRPFSQTVDFELRRIQPGTWESIQGKGGILDISSKGLGLISEIPVKAGEILKFNLPGNLKGISIPVLSEVRWAKSEGNRCRAGLRFIS
jgi:hypothetical protein